MDTKAVLEFIKALLPYVPMAVQGLTVAKDIIIWGFSAVGTMVEEDRDPTEEEWAQLNSKVAAIRERLHSDEI